MTKFVQTLATRISEYVLELGLPYAGIDEISWLLERWPIYSKPSRTIDVGDVTEASSHFENLAKGRRKLYWFALNNIIQYLGDTCQWQIPKKNENKLIDHELKWMEAIVLEANHVY
ncbi:hypothetical protein KDN34_05610 [Shewanella yunxiaonensis]|uniref:Uncharacterized protein n=1 Tax=Shewanella yunxiaonensis TaxID=2829809 RepID=A0ABX7YX70_9GAMM|nr:hypothetical protein [Shewanella yunxiaonensis]QUN06920.1 hypothetical protein KDN34_05610 [Shewanella yunxiaonensis]